ncbi:MAG: acyltransferase [Acidobacteriota bacterium]|nr:acyltransferase [Acidobacteriota bacterium]
MMNLDQEAALPQVNMQPERRNAPGERRRIKGLDGIRAVAFLMVLGGHSGYSWIPNGFGVTVFFFLSGYLITTLLRLEWLEKQDISIGEFYIRRTFRILPPFYIAVIFAITMAAAGLTPSSVHWKSLVVVQLFLTNYSDYLIGSTMTTGLIVLWSLAVEEHFYLIFPWAYRALLKKVSGVSRQVILFGGLCLLVLVWRTVLMIVFHADWHRVYSGTDTRVDSILYGSILAIAANPAIDRIDYLSRRQCTWVAFAGAVILAVSIAARDEIFRQTVRYTIQGLALLPIFFFVVRYSDSALTRMLEARVLTHVGELSYSLYLVHATVLVMVQTFVGRQPLVDLALTSAISYPLALGIYRFVERPSHRLRNRALRMYQYRSLNAEPVSAS